MEYPASDMKNNLTNDMQARFHAHIVDDRQGIVKHSSSNMMWNIYHKQEAT